MMNLLNTDQRPSTVVMTATDIHAIEIERGIPMPERRNGRRNHNGTGIGSSPVWEKMEVGDSFMVPTAFPLHIIASTAYDKGCKLGRDFSVRKALDGTLRVWRTK